MTFAGLPPMSGTPSAVVVPKRVFCWATGSK